MSQISQEELEEFNEIFENLDIKLQSKVKTMLTNFSLQKERFADMYTTFEFNLNKDRENQRNNKVPVQFDVI
jgi:hypothetical protein